MNQRPQKAGPHGRLSAFGWSVGKVLGASTFEAVIKVPVLDSFLGTPVDSECSKPKAASCVIASASLDTGMKALTAFVDRLVAEGDALLTKTHQLSGSYIGGVPLEVDRVAFRLWSAQVQGLRQLMGSIADAWDRALTANSPGLESVRCTQGSLKAIQIMLREGLLVRLSDLVHAEVHADLAEQADHLLEQGYALAAGVIFRTVLEDHLRKQCANHGCMPAKKRPTMADYYQALEGAQHITKLDRKNIEDMTAIGNAAAHADPSLKPEDVVRLAGDVRRFMGASQ